MQLEPLASTFVSGLYGYIMDGDLLLMKLNNLTMCIWNWVSDTWGIFNLDGSPEVGNDWVSLHLV